MKIYGVSSEGVTGGRSIATYQLFKTQNRDDRADTGPLTTAMEDYLEMICRLTRSGGYTRISALARELHVQPSSASKMAALLRSGGYLTNERYGCLRLTEKGSQAGAYLLYRHDVLNRLLRRIIRDFNYRGYSAQETISRWPSVRAGEDKWIFPYQENADVMFNSALLFEFAVLRCHAEPILTSVPRNCPEYAEAYRLLKFIKYFTPVQDKEIPPTSLLREFLGGSSFKY